MNSRCRLGIACSQTLILCTDTKKNLKSFSTFSSSPESKVFMLGEHAQRPKKNISDKKKIYKGVSAL